MRALLLAVAVCALAATVAGCGSSGAKPASTPPWVEKANAVCKRDDPKIKAAEQEAYGVYFTANMVQHWFAELKELGRTALFVQMPSLQADARRAYRIIRYTGNVPRSNNALLRMKREAAARGVHCSFGAVPPSQILK